MIPALENGCSYSALKQDKKTDNPGHSRVSGLSLQAPTHFFPTSFCFPASLLFPLFQPNLPLLVMLPAATCSTSSSTRSHLSQCVYEN